MRWLLGALVIAAALVWLRDPMVQHARVWLFLADQLPQVPIKPLRLVTAPSQQTQVSLGAPDQRVIGDLFVPSGRIGPLAPPTRPAIVLAMGIHLRERDRPALFHLADTLARLGYVVLWPRSGAIDSGQRWGLEEPAVFVTAIRHLEQLEGVDRTRISLFGFSIGASVGLVAAADPTVAHTTRAVVAFGAYYDLADYLLSLATASASLNGQTLPWQPAADALEQARTVLSAEGHGELLQPSPREIAEPRIRAQSAPLERFSPSRHLDRLRARVFILHDRGDQYVPYTESVKLQRALPPAQIGGVLTPGLFQHVRVAESLSPDALGDLLALYGFVHAALSYV